MFGKNNDILSCFFIILTTGAAAMINGNGSVDGIRRQLYMLAFGIPDTGEQHPILDWHMREIRALLDAKGVSEQGMLDYYGISTLEGMSMDQWNDAVQRLKKQKDKPKDV